jgi:hypothetical protein
MILRISSVPFGAKTKRGGNRLYSSFATLISETHHLLSTVEAIEENSSKQTAAPSQDEVVSVRCM